MALDSAEKRKAVPGVARPWHRSQYIHAAKDAAWRVQVGNSYPVFIPGPYIPSSAGVDKFFTVSVSAVRFCSIESSACWVAVQLQPWYQTGGEGPVIESRVMINPASELSADILLKAPRTGEGVVRIMEGQHGKIFNTEPIVKIAAYNVNVDNSQLRDMVMEVRKVAAPPGTYVAVQDSVVLPKENRYIRRRRKI